MRRFIESLGSSPYVSVVGNRSFRALWFSQISSQLAVSIMLYVLALRIYQLTASSSAVSGLFLSFGVPSLLFGMGAGAIVDHFDKRAILRMCDIFRAIVSIGLLFAMKNIAAVYVLSFFNAVVTQLYTPAEGPTIARLVPKKQLVTANSLFSFTYYSSLAMGSIMAGPILRLFGPTWVFILISCLFLFAFMNASKLPVETGKRTLRSITYGMIAYGSVRIVQSVFNGISYMKRTPVLMDAVLLLTGTQIILSMLATLAPAFADRLLEIDVNDASVVIVGPVVAGIIVGAVWVGNRGFQEGTERLIRRGVLLAGLLLLTLSAVVWLRKITVLMFFFKNPFVSIPLVLLVLFFLGIANSLLDVPANSVIQRESEGDMRGRVYGLLATAVGGIGILPVVLGGILADTIGIGKVVFLLGIIITGFGIYRYRLPIPK